MDQWFDGKRFGVCAERVGVAIHCDPARLPEDRRGVWGGGLGPEALGAVSRLSALERFWAFVFALLLVPFLFVDVAHTNINSEP